MTANIRRRGIGANSGAVWAAAALLLLAVAPANAQDEPLPPAPPIASWREYAYAEDGFAVTAPAPALKDKRMTGPAKAQVEAHSYSFFPPPPGTVFMVTVTKLKDTDKRPDDQVIADMLKGKGAATAVTSQDELKGLEVTSDQGEYKTLMRVFVKDRRMYQLTVTAKIEGFPHPQQDNWLASWHTVHVDEPPQ